MTAVNRSLNKVRVRKDFGDGATVGLTSPQINMLVKFYTDARYIIATNVGGDPGQVKLSKTLGGTECARAYPHQLSIDLTQAAGSFSFPTAGNGDVTFAHSIAAASTGLNKFETSEGGIPASHTYSGQLAGG